MRCTNIVSTLGYGPFLQRLHAEIHSTTCLSALCIAPTPPFLSLSFPPNRSRGGESGSEQVGRTLRVGDFPSLALGQLLYPHARLPVIML